MAGYLTHLMILIKAEAWLGELITGLETRQRTQTACMTELEETLLSLARSARALLRVDPAAAQQLPATRITNQVGTGLSKYAMIGAIGMDFPINGYVFALNRDWVSRTMRLGAPRRAYVDAGSTDFVLNFIKALNDAGQGLTAEQQRAMRSYALGHLAGVAADVVLQPAINSWAWSATNTSHLSQHRFKVQLDARVAHGYFQRDSLHRGQSWEQYFLDNGQVEDRNEKLTKVFLKAFTDTYGVTRPTEAICATNTCRVPEITEAFLKDGYANTKGWAIGVGYDQSPWAWYKWLLSLFVMGGGMISVAFIWSSTSTYNIASWRTGDAFKTERLWSDLLSNANTWAGAVYLPFTLLARFPIIWDGIFGPGAIKATQRPGGKATVQISKGILDFVSPLFDLTMFIAGAADRNGAFFTSVDPVVQDPITRWLRFAVGSVLELVKTFWIDMGSVEEGVEGDPLAFTMFWPVKVATFGTYFLSVLVVFGAKSARKNEGTEIREDTAKFCDYALGMIFPAIYIGVAWCTGFWEDYVLEKTAGARWPAPGTSDVDRYLPVTSNGSRHFTATGATGFPVRLFGSDNGGIVTANNREHYAEAAEASPWASVRERDDAARKEKSVPSSHSDYNMNDLIDHAARLAGLLAMAAVNYDASGPRLRDSVNEIFKDWNLDYRTISEWDALMKESSGTDRGLLIATAQWADDLKNTRPATDAGVLERIEQEMVVTGSCAKILADFSHTRMTPESIAAPFTDDARCGRLRRPGAILLPNLDFEQTITTPLPTPLPVRVTNVDALANNTIESADDRKDLTNFTLKRPARPGADSLQLQLNVNPQDAARIRIFEASETDPPPSWLRRMGANTGGGDDNSYTIPSGSTGDLNFCVEALTLAGDPVRSAPTVPAPVGRDGVTPVVPARKPSDIWLEVIHQDGGTELRTLRDVSLFTITPWLMFSNLQPTERLYIVYLKEFVDRDDVVHANHSTVTDVIDAMVAVFGAAEVPVQRRTISSGGFDYIPHQPLPAGDANAAKKLYLIDGFEYCNDQWIQDEIEIGYCWAPHASTRMTIHVPRKRGLEGFVHKELPGPDMAVFNGLNKERDTLNYGGNLEVSPPVMQATTQITADAAGLAVPAQPIARFGKLLLGEGLIRLTTTLDTSIAGDLNAGGIIPSAVQTEFAAKHLGALAQVANVTVVTAGSEWRIGMRGPGAPPVDPVAVRLESGDLNVYEIRIPGPDQLLFSIDPGLVTDFDAGGAPTERIQEVFLHGLDLVIRHIVVITAGSEWVLQFEHTPARLTVQLFAGRLEIVEGSEVLWRIDSNSALIADLDGGTPAAIERIQNAFTLFFCRAHPLSVPLQVPRITTRVADNEWLMTRTGTPAERMLLIRREGTHLSLFEARIATPPFRSFLEAQAVQPILAFDTSWLHVGHVDEVAIFVPSNAPKGYKLLMSSTQLATLILTEAIAQGGPVTKLFRGKQRLVPSSGHQFEVAAEVTVSDLLTSHRSANDTIQADHLSPIETRLRAGLLLEQHATERDRQDIVYLPIYYDMPDLPPGFTVGLTSAHFPHPINLQVISRLNDSGQLERHVIVPRPFGPRMRPADALVVLTNAHVNGVELRRLTPMAGGHFEWARKDTLLSALATTFGVTEANIRDHSNNRGKFAAGKVKNNWDRIWIPEDNVDLFEACIQILLEDIGLTVHWVDDWETYHRRTGEIHCGTNVVRTPPEAAPGYSGPYWWDHYNA
ncbi:MAG TPA: protein-arginine deiminase family protein [Pyrinomonadaceae bacterium]|jgi:hypothetical protein